MLSNKNTPGIFENSIYPVNPGQKIIVYTEDSITKGKLQEISDTAIKVNDVWVNFSRIKKIGIITFAKIVGCVLGVPLLILGAATIIAAGIAITVGSIWVIVGYLYKETEVLKIGLITFGSGLVAEIIGYGIITVPFKYLFDLNKDFDTITNWKIEVHKR